MTKTMQVWRLPNIEGIEIKSWKYNSFLIALGISKKERDISFSLSKENISNNLLLWHDQKMLINSIGKVIYSDNSKCVAYIKKHNNHVENKVFWSLAREIMLRNESYMIRHFLKLDIKLFRERKISEIRKIIIEARHKILSGSLKIELKRKWLQAPAPKCRSLTIPSIVDRLIASMWTEILELYLKGSIDPSNHGYQEGRGTKTALEDLLTKHKDYPIIYEFDLANFFPSVNHKILEEILRKYGLPQYMIIYFLLPLQQKPKLDLNLEVIDYETGAETIRFKSIYEKINYKGESNYVLNKGRNVGVPMGLGYSPLLAMLVLCEVLSEWKDPTNNYVTYADDGLLFMKNKEDIERFQTILRKYWLKINLAKSQIVKDQKSLLNYKFLGILFNKDDSLESKTRKGVNIGLNLIKEWSETIMDLKKLYIADKLISLMHWSNSWNLIVFLWDLKDSILRKVKQSQKTIYMRRKIHYSELIDAKVFGTILARLYSPVEEVSQNFNLEYVANSITSKVVGIKSSKGNALSEIRSQNVSKLKFECSREFHSSSANQMKLIRYYSSKWSNAFTIYDELGEEIRPWTRTTVFNQSTSGSSWLVKECHKINESIALEYAREKEQLWTSENLHKFYNEKWIEQQKLIAREELEFGRSITIEGEGKIYEVQIGSRNFDMLLSKGGFKVDKR